MPSVRRRVRLFDQTTKTFVSAPPVTLWIEPPPPPPPPAETTTTIVVRNIIFHLDADYPTGRYVNGDPWVAPLTAGGSVTITAMDPPILYSDTKPGDKSTCLNGAMIDPVGGTKQGFTHRLTGYDPSVNVADAPVTLTPVDKPITLIKSQALDPGDFTAKCGNTTGHPPCLQDVALLTVLPAVPPGQGADMFRPPYCAGSKQQFTTADIREDLLPSLAKPYTDLKPTLAQLEHHFRGTQLDFPGSWTARYLHPVRSYMNYSGSGEVHNYGSDIGKDYNDACLRLMVDDPIADKRPALRQVLQACIDLAGCAEAGTTWHADGGHHVGRKVMCTFGAVILDSQWMKDIAGTSNSGRFSENRHVYRSPEPVMNGMALYGKPGTLSSYEKVRLQTGSGSRDQRDPHGVVDGGEVAGSTYLVCCTFRSYKASALVAMLLPGGQAIWKLHDPDQGEAFFEWVDRFVHIGTWVVNKDGNGNQILGSDGLVRTWLTGGVWKPDTDLHLRNADHGHYGSSLQHAMWSAYRNAAKDGRPAFPHYAKRTQHLPA